MSFLIDIPTTHYFAGNMEKGHFFTTYKEISVCQFTEVFFFSLFFYILLKAFKFCMCACEFVDFFPTLDGTNSIPANLRPQ